MEVLWDQGDAEALQHKPQPELVAASLWDRKYHVLSCFFADILSFQLPMMPFNLPNFYQPTTKTIIQ